MNIDFTETQKQQQIIDLIIKASSYADSSTHQSTLQALNEIEKNTISFISLLLDAILNYKNTIDSKGYFEQTQVMIYFKNCLDRNKDNPNIKNIPQLEQKIINFLNLYLDFIFGDGKLIYFFEDSIEYLIYIVNSMEEARRILENIFLNVVKLRLSQGIVPTEETIKKVTFLFEKIIYQYLNYVLNDDDINFIFEFYNFLLGQCEIVAYAINERIKDKESNDYYTTMEKNARMFSTVQMSFARASMKINEFFLKNCVYDFSFYSEMNNKKSTFIESASFMSFIEHSLMITFNNTSKTHIKDIFLILLQQIDDDYTYNNIFNLNISKGKAFIIELITIFIDKLNKFNIIDKFPKFNDLVIKVARMTINHISSIYSSDNYPKHDPENDNPVDATNLNLLVKLMLFLETLCNTPLSSVIVEKKFDIIQFIILRNIDITPFEKILFNTDAEEYVRNELDLCHSCEERLPKHKALRLLNAMCEKIEGVFPYMVELSIKLINKLSNVNDTSVNVTDNDIVYLFINRTMNDTSKMHVALMILTSVSFLFPEREKIYDSFEESIDLVNHILIKINDDFLKASLCMFYAYNLDSMFHNDTEVLSKSFDDAVEFLFLCIVNNETSESLFKIAINCMISIIFEKHLIKFCGNMVKIFTNKVIIKIQTSSFKPFENDFTFFVQGLIKHYLSNIDVNVVDIFDFFWETFQTSIQGVDNKRKALKEKKDYSGILKNIDIINIFLSSISNKPTDIKEKIYLKVLNILFNLGQFLNLDFEENILKMLITIINDIKSLPESYMSSLISYMTSLNAGTDGVFDYKIESYHISFIFTMLSAFNREVLVSSKIKQILYDFLSCRLSTIPKKTSVSKIIVEHIVFIDFITVFSMFFYDSLSKEEITSLLNLLFTRMNKPPNTDLDLNVKLSIAIFILIIKLDNFETLRSFDISSFMNKLSNFFPLKTLCEKQHEIVTLGLGYLNRFVLIDSPNGFSSMKQIENTITSITKVMISELMLIKKSSLEKFKKDSTVKEENKDEEMIEEEDEENKRYSFSKRKAHEEVMKNSKLVTDLNDSDYLNDSDIDSEKAIDEENKNIDNNIDMNMSDDDDDDFDENFDYDSDSDDKDDDFIHVKKAPDEFETYFIKFADASFVNFINKINQFNFFDLMLKEIEGTNQKLYKKIIGSLNGNKMKLVEKFRKYQKIAFSKTDSTGRTQDYLYRQILKIKK